MTATEPHRVREPACIHSGNEMRSQRPASYCRICRDSPELAKWHADWAAWLAENPDSPEAHIRERLDEQAGEPA